MRKTLSLLFFTIVTSATIAQSPYAYLEAMHVFRFFSPPNDECFSAYEIPDVQNWCSEVNLYDNTEATQSAEDTPICIPNNQENHDVWFSFVALANTVNVSVVGDVQNNAGGTLENPQVVVYGGDCMALYDLGCSSDAVGNNQVNVFAGPLDIGATYYIRVGARFGQEGSFQLCVNNYNQVPPPDGDCEPGVILCDKSPFTVDFLNGVGDDPFEINADDICGCPISESGSTWYKWTCDESGSLEFAITPLNPTDDIDFVIYELPNDVFDCSGKTPLRCMASGENVGSPISDWIACTGATGMMIGDGDVSETCGCQSGNNNFIEAIDMVSGVAYALVINNFSQSGAGFSIEFGGTGTFLGPEAGFNMTATTVCVGDTVYYEDESTFEGNIIGRTWDFGPEAFPRYASGVGPHAITYTNAGEHQVVLVVETERGCIVTEVSAGAESICCDDGIFGEALNLGDDMVICEGGTYTIALDIPQSEIEWSDGSTGSTLTISESGTYWAEVFIGDCSYSTDTIIVTYGNIDPMIGPDVQLCDGETHTFEINIDSAEVVWNTGDTGTTLEVSEAGDYWATVSTIDGCIANSDTATVTVISLDPTIGPDAHLCEGETHIFEINIDSAEVVWNTGATGATLEASEAGDYWATVTLDGCTENSDTASITTTSFEAVIGPGASICEGESHILEVDIDGDEVLWSTGDTGTSLEVTETGDYWATVTVDGCTENSDTVTITFNEVQTELGDDVIICVGETHTLDIDIANANVLWSTGDTGNTLEISTSGTYSAEVSIDDCVYSTETVTVTVIDPELELITDLSEAICLWDDEITLETTQSVTGSLEYYINGDAFDGTIRPEELGEGNYNLMVILTADQADNCIASVMESFVIDRHCEVTLGGAAWFDVNVNGIWDIDETPIAQVDVSVYDTNGNLMGETVTDAVGEYQFTLPPGEYQLLFDERTGLSTSPQDMGNDDTLDSDIAPTTGWTTTINMVDSSTDLTWDAGFYTPCENIDNPGDIGYNQMVCGPGSYGDVIQNLESASGGDGPIEYMWMMTTDDPNVAFDLWTPVPNSNSASLNPGRIFETTYFARCARNEGCIAFLETSNIVVIEVGDDAVAEIEGQAYDLCTDETYTYTALGVSPTADIQWDFGPAASPRFSTDASVNVSFSSFGSFMVVLAVTDNDCTSVDFANVVVSNDPDLCGTGSRSALLNGATESYSYKLYPNPVKDRLYISVPVNDKAFTVEVFNISGSKVQTLQFGGNEQVLDIPFSDMPKGVYVVQIRDLEGVVAKVWKVVK